MTLFSKLALAVSTLVVGTTLCLSASFYWMERRAILQQADQERRSILLNLAHMARESVLANDDLLLVKYARGLRRWNPALLSASIVSPHGDVLAHSAPGLIGRPALVGPPPHASADVLVITEPVFIGTHWVATASVAFSQQALVSAVRQRQGELQKRIAVIAIGAFGLGLLMAFVLALSWTRPIGALARAAQEVGEGQYAGGLVSTRRRRDELGFLARSFESMAIRLKELELMKEDFVSAVTHELRSPLGAIESYLNLIHHELRQGVSTDAWERYVERLRVNTRRLSQFVNDLLDVAAIERGKVTLQLEPLSLPALLSDVLELYAARLQERHLHYRLEVQQGTPLIPADPEKLRQILGNLLSNAIKFTPEEGHIELGATIVRGKGIRVYVKDSGIGIDPAHQERIFKKFEQARTAREHVKGPKGTGLGLAISQALVEQHGGTLTVESRPGQGSLFAFTLPTHPLEEA